MEEEDDGDAGIFNGDGGFCNLEEMESFRKKEEEDEVFCFNSDSSGTH